MQVTIIIPRAAVSEPIMNCIHSLQSKMPNSIILVLDMTLEQEKIVKNNVPITIRSDLLSASCARNLGAFYAATPYIFFVDADCILESSLLGQNKLDLSILDSPDLIILQRAEADRQIQSTLPTKYNFSLHCIEWNCIWRREHFLNLGGFDERFGPGSPTMAQTGEAFSLCFKHFAMKNTRTVYLPDIKVHHPSLDNHDKSPQRQFQYAYGSHYAAFEPFLRSPSRLATFWFLRTLAGFGKDIPQAPLSFRARALALYDVVFGHQPRAKS